MAERLYNGVSLPVLPEWDKGAYPYAYIAQNIGVTAYILTVAAERPVYGPDPLDGSVNSVYHYGRSASSLVHEGAWLLMEEAEELVHVREDVGKVIWTNTDILRPDGSIYLAAESNFMGSFQVGLALGLCGTPLPFADCGGSPEKPDLPSRVPVAYLYNGVRLPPLPEWDRTEYPYAVIEGYQDSYTTVSSGSYSQYLLVSKEPLVVHKSSSTSTYLYLYGLKGAKNWLCRSTTDFASWEEGKEYSYDSRNCWYGNENQYDPHRLMWANYDVMNTDHNSIFCGKSEPIPVYE